MPNSVVKNRQDGFSLIEVMAALSISVLMVLCLHTSILSSVQQRERSDFHQRVRGIAYDYMQTLLAIPFGSGSAGTARPAELQELFDLDDDVGTATLRSVQTPVGDSGHSFTLATEGVDVLFRVVVQSDLNGDGTTDGFREGRSDLLKIELFADGRLLFETIRAADFETTAKD